MATYYVRTDGNNGNIGTLDSAGGSWATIQYAATQIIAGDTVMIRASAGNASSYPTSSLDYTISSYFTPPAGSATAGFTKWVGYNGIPTIGSPGLGLYLCNYQYLEGLYLVATANTFGGNGMINTEAYSVLKNCIINMNSQTSLVGVLLKTGSEMLSCEIYGGSTSPTSSSGCWGVEMVAYGCMLQGCRVRCCRDHGVYGSNSNNGMQLLNNLIYNNVGDGVNSAQDTSGVLIGRVIGNTIHGNSGHGINLTATNGAAFNAIRNNNVTSHVQSGKSGINVATATSDKRKPGWGWNNVWNNTTNYTNVTADSTDLSVDPGYADAANGDFTPSEATLEGAAFPTDF